jgi:hypothetical protein
MSTSLIDPLGFRLDGRPFWGFSGAEGEDTGDGGDSDSGDTDSGGDTETDPVKKLEAKYETAAKERKQARDELRPWKAALRELGIQDPGQLKELLTKGSGAGAQEQVDVEKIRETERAAVRLESNREIALAKVEAKAKGMFADPSDAVDYLRKNVDDLLDRDGKPDPKSIERELGDLLEAKPHWGVSKQEDMDFDGGVRQTAGGKQSMDDFLRKTSRTKRGG